MQLMNTSHFVLLFFLVPLQAKRSLDEHFSDIHLSRDGGWSVPLAKWRTGELSRINGLTNESSVSRSASSSFLANDGSDFSSLSVLKDHNVVVVVIVGLIVMVMLGFCALPIIIHSWIGSAAGNQRNSGATIDPTTREDLEKRFHRTSDSERIRNAVRHSRLSARLSTGTIDMVSALDQSPLASRIASPNKDGDGSDEQDARIEVSPKKTSKHTIDLPSFYIEGADGHSRFFKWMSSRDSTVASLPSAHSDIPEGCPERSSIERIPVPWSEVGLQSIFRSRANFQIESWGPQSFEQLLEELNTGQAVLVQDGDGLYRSVDVVLVVIFQEGSKDVLVSNVPGDFGDEVPSVRKGVHETIAQAAKRCVVEQQSDSVRLLLEQSTTMEEQETSSPFPGLITIVRKHLVMGTVEKDVKEEKFQDAQHWKPMTKVSSLQKHRSWLAKRIDASLSGKTASSVSYSEQARSLRLSLQKDKAILQCNARNIVLPWSPEEVDKLLQAHGVTPETFGTSLEDLSKRASSGLVSFIKLAPSGCSSSSSCEAGTVFLARDIVLLRVESEHCKAVLVEAVDKAETIHWPRAVRMSHETIWETVRVMLRQQLNLRDDPPLLHVSFELQEVDLDVSDLLQAGPPRDIIDRQWLVTAQIPLGSEPQLSGISPPIPSS